MANNYTKILELANKNNMGLSNTIKRDYGIPLDYSSVQETYEAALAYAQTSTLAYIGQPISVGDTLYVVTDEAGGWLKPVGTVPTGDEVSITIGDDGKIALYGFEAAETATLPRKKHDGTIEWLPVSSIVAGDGNERTRVVAGENSDITVTPSYNASTDTYTYTLDVTLPAVPAYAVTKEVGEDSVTYKLTKDNEAIGEAIVVPNAYNDSLLASKIGTLETTTGNIDDRLATVEAFFDGAASDSAGLNDALDKLVEIQEYLKGDGTAADDLLTKVGANTSAISTLTGTGEGSVTKIVSDAIAEHAEDADGKYALASDVSLLGDAVEAAAVAADVEAALAGKVNTSALNNYYTKSETYSQQEISDLLSNITGTTQQTAGEVAAQLANYKETNNAAVAGLRTDVDTNTGNITANTTAITAINNPSTGILAQAIANADSVKTELQGAINQNASAIANVDAKVDNTNGNVTNLTGRVGALEQADIDINNSIAGLSSAHETLSTTVGKNTTAITLLQDRATEIEASIATHSEKFKDYSTTQQMTDAITAAINGIDTTDLSNGISTNATAIADEVIRAKAREDEIAEIAAQNAADISTVNDLLADALENNKEGLDSIKELAVWVSEHETEVLPTIQANTEAIAILNGEDEGSVKKAISDAIGAIPTATTTVAGMVKASDEIATDDEGRMSITSISTDKLVQGAETLILNGGNAETTAQN